MSASAGGARGPPIGAASVIRSVSARESLLLARRVAEWVRREAPVRPRVGDPPAGVSAPIARHEVAVALRGADAYDRPMRRGGKALGLALVLATGGVARAQEEGAPSGDGAVGKYQGVAPGEGAPDGRKPPRHGRTPTVTWLGFQPQPGGGARVFVQLDREVAHPQEVVDGALVVSLVGARVAHSNSRRFLDTRFFDTAVERVAIEPVRRKARGARPSGGGLELIIRFKDPATARELTSSMSAGKDGFTYLTVNVPASSPAQSNTGPNKAGTAEPRADLDDGD